MEHLKQPSEWETAIAQTAEGPAAQLHIDLLRLHSLLRDHIRQKYDRSIPLADELTDRWERARFLGFGAGASIYDSALVIGDVQVGEKTWVGPNCVLDGSGGLRVGAYCSIATGCQLYSHDTVEWALSGGRAPYRKRASVIGDACYLGPNSIVASGTILGDHCLVGALSFVKGKVPAYSIVVGIPARVVGRVHLERDGGVRLTYDKTDSKQSESSGAGS